MTRLEQPALTRLLTCSQAQSPWPCVHALNGVNGVKPPLMGQGCVLHAGLCFSPFANGHAWPLKFFGVVTVYVRVLAPLPQDLLQAL